MSYTCFRCNYVATNKYNLERHLKNKKICKPYCELLESFERDEMINIIKNDEDILQKSKDIIDFQQNKIIELETKIKELEKENSQKQESINNYNTTDSYNTHINSHNTIINNHYHTHNHTITLNMIFLEDMCEDEPTYNGKDNTYQLLKKKVGYIFSWPNEAFERMVKLIHFHDDYPENHNMYMSSKRDGWFCSYGLNKEKTWSLMKKKDFLKLYVKERYEGTFNRLIELMDERLKKDKFWESTTDIRINQYEFIKKHNKLFRDKEDTKKEFQDYMRQLERKVEGICIQEFDKRKEQQQQKQMA